MTGRWSTPREALRLCFSQRALRRTVPIALLVGTVLTLINQGSVIASGRASWITWLRTGANFLVPFLVSSTGYISAMRIEKSD